MIRLPGRSGTGSGRIAAIFASTSAVNGYASSAFISPPQHVHRRDAFSGSTSPPT
ncbi:hypothetical protein [Nocardia noduli]|uniref:hypothetical protein n=1 Tax=Nocardia noduli TaxID=2815722 RepID=UPI001C2374DB|nr:hypothetical protein [Nocardia noduli]